MMFATGNVEPTGSILMPLIPVIVPFLLIFAMKFLWSKYHDTNCDSSFAEPLPDGSMGWPLVGETFQFLYQSVDFYKNKFAKHGRVFKTHILGKPIIRIYGAENLQKIFQAENEYLFPSLPKSASVILGTHVLSQAVGERHTSMRRKVLRAFRHSVLSMYVPMIHSEIARTLSGWSKRPTVVMYHELGDLVFRVASRTLCGFNYSPEETRSLTRTFETMVDNMFSLPINLPGSGLTKAKAARKVLVDKIKSKVEMKRAIPLTGDHNDALSKLMEYIEDDEDDSQLTNEQIMAVAVELLFNGYSTSTSAATMLVLNLTKYPEIVEKMREELVEHGLIDTSRPLEFEEIQKLKYLNCVIKESLRMSPPVGGGFREVKKTFILEGKQIPKGWTILWSIRETMSHSTIYTKGEEFDPERFNSERKEDKIGSRHNYCVFGGGSRGCIGKQYALLFLKLLTIELVRSCQWERETEGEDHMTYLPVPRPTDGLLLKFSKKDKLDANANVQCYVHVDEIGPNSRVDSPPTLV
ncbi:cytochrome P450 26B1-like [Antedon mediterranea]|uniref:cytochrome P450 26B1-like n=1 Tax=Antedon mediterranea TaxID=105859 RepID=UPI003AF93FCD